MLKLLYKPLGAVVSVLGGLLATAVFRKLWKAVAGDDDAPEATDRGRGWGSVLSAAALQGATYGLVKAAVDRAGATGFSKATGEWPGRD